MLNYDQEREFERRFAATRIMAAAMAGGVLAAGGLVAAASRLQAARAAASPPDRAPAPVRWALDSLLLLAVLGGPFLKDRLLSDSALLPSARGGVAALTAQIQTRLIVLLSLCEGTAFLGIILFLMSNKPLDLLPAGIASLAGFAGLWPDRLRWRERVESLLGR